MDNPRKLVTTVVAESERLVAYLRALPPEGWQRQSACDRWTVADVVAHLTNGARLYARMVRQGLEGRPEPFVRPPGWNVADSAIELRKTLGDRLLPEFLARNDELNGVLLSLGPEEFPKTTIYADMTVPIWYMALARLTEATLHEWDIRQPVDKGFHLSPAALPYLVERVPEWLSRTFRKGEPVESPVRYRFDLAPPVARSIGLAITGDDCQVAEAGGARPHVTFATSAEDYVLLHFGRLNLQQAVQEGRIRVQGDHDKAAQFPNWFKTR